MDLISSLYHRIQKADLQYLAEKVTPELLFKTGDTVCVHILVCTRVYVQYVCVRTLIAPAMNEKENNELTVRVAIVLRFQVSTNWLRLPVSHPLGNICFSLDSKI